MYCMYMNLHTVTDNQSSPEFEIDLTNTFKKQQKKKKQKERKKERKQCVLLIKFYIKIEMKKEKKNTFK